MIRSAKNFIIGVSSFEMTQEELSFISTYKPIGLILFKRNCDNPDQIKSLVHEFKSLYQDFEPLILIDQEGGRVSRLPSSFFDSTPSMKELVSIANKDLNNREAAYINVYNNFYNIGVNLKLLGINVNCAPVSDLYIEGAHSVIGDRSFGSDPDFVAHMSAAASKGLADAGVQSVIKHIPGHGRSKVDSHHDLPIVNEKLDVLEKTDFKVFRNLSTEKIAMTAHIVYKELDDQRCATVSPILINYIRNNIGFKGIILTDDLSMQALNGTIKDRALDAMEAGCDILLHCNGKMEEMLEVAEVAEYINESLWQKIEALDCFINRFESDDLMQL